MNANDRTVLRDLAKQVRDVAALPVMAERRELWRRHNRLEGGRPMVLVFPEGSWRELLPADAMTCEDEGARDIEWRLRHKLYCHTHLNDDAVIENEWIVNKRIRDTGWGLEPERIPTDQDTGACAFEPVFRGPESLEDMHQPEVEYDGAGTAKDHEAAQDLLGDILEVKLRGIQHISFHPVALYASRRGHENALLDMCTNPTMVHDAMAFFEQGYRRLLEQWLELGLIGLNNDGTYQNSGGVSYSDELPKPGFDGETVRLCDLWASAEAQEMAGVSPEMHEQFALQYERRLLEPFGLAGYGCCEDLTLKLGRVLTIPNIRRISISPFANVDPCAEQLGNQAIFSWKPHPSHVVGGFDPGHVRRYIQHTVDATRGGTLEMILKDTHTCENHPERFTEWTRIAREIAETAP